MPGMGTYLQTKNPVVVSAFHTSLLRQTFVVGLILVVLMLVWNVARTVRFRRNAASGPLAPGPAGSGAAAPFDPEPPAMRVLRIGFGALWILDGFLQLQSAMPLGMPSNVLQPAASSSPGWVQHVVNVGVSTWSKHPVEAAASAVWIQLGIGVLLVVAPRGRWTQAAGLASVVWGLVVWVFGEAFGGIFGGGASFMFGLPGAVLFYCAAGALLMVPERLWVDGRLGRLVVRTLGAFLLGMAVLQAWPGRGFWQGQIHGSQGSVTSMVEQMVSTPQPHVLSSWLASFAAFDAAHGWGVNLFVVVALAGIGAALVTGRRGAVAVAVAAAATLCLADWVLVEDMGFFGGVGTDPNSMIPFLVVLASGSLALAPRRAPVTATARVAWPAAEVSPVQATSSEPAVAAVAATASDGASPVLASGWSDRFGFLSVGRVVAALAALGVVVVGAAPMAMAAANPNADTLLAVAADGSPNDVDLPAPNFDLVDQHDRPVSLADLRGKTVALTFLDPVCTSDCPVIAQEFHQADELLGGDARHAEMVAVVANPVDRSVAFTQAFDHQEGLDDVRNWLYLTGPLGELQHVWSSYGIEVAVAPAGAMVAHSELAYIIDPAGDTREVLSVDPGGSSASNSSFAVLISQEIQRVGGE